jgi:hypothetical protein
METIENLLKDYILFEKRSALYYLTRYIKQAKIFKNYEKDIFVDDKNSSPTEKVKALTLRLIDIIEKVANKKAVEFDEKEFFFWMDTIADIEDNLDFEPNETQVQNALKTLDNFETPKI